MPVSTSILTFISAGTHASRPFSPSVPSGCSALYYETDTLHWFAWNGSAWVECPVFTGDSGSGGLIGYVPAPGAGDAAAEKFLWAGGSFKTVNGGVDSRNTVAETISSDSHGKMVKFTYSGNVAVNVDSSVSSNFFCAARNQGSGYANFTPSSGQINGGATLALATGTGTWLYFDGADWWTSP